MTLGKVGNALFSLSFTIALFGLVELFILTSFGRESVSLSLMEGEGLLLELAHGVFCFDNLQTAPRLDSFIFWRLVMGYVILLALSGFVITQIRKKSAV